MLLLILLPLPRYDLLALGLQGDGLLALPFGRVSSMRAGRLDAATGPGGGGEVVVNIDGDYNSAHGPGYNSKPPWSNNTRAAFFGCNNPFGLPSHPEVGRFFLGQEACVCQRNNLVVAGVGGFAVVGLGPGDHVLDQGGDGDGSGGLKAGNLLRGVGNDGLPPRNVRRQ